ncbi:MAG TPA: tetratricopeptide repeat protein [Nitrospiraceae bacterium]|nr:tetratricopeptide repeat protein [Nitrospiraceae bacterium]
MEQPKSANDHYERGRVLKHSHMFDQALEEFQHVASDPQYAGNAHVQIALCLLATGRYDDAAEAFRQALEVGTFSSKEKAHILYFLGQTLESLGRYAEAMEAYCWTRKEVPGFQDVAQRIKHLLAGGRGLLPRRRPASRSVVGDILKLGGQLTPQVLSLLGQAWTSFGQYADRLGHHREDQKQSPSFRDVGHPGERDLTPTRCSPPAPRDRKRDTRRHVRVAVRLHSHFSSKGRRVTGDGELRDISPGGCRVRSLVAVPVGAELECCIFSQDTGNPFTIDGATVRWSRPQEFGLAFTKVRPGVQRQITQLCHPRTPLGVDI